MNQILISYENTKYKYLLLFGKIFFVCKKRKIYLQNIEKKYCILYNYKCKKRKVTKTGFEIHKTFSKSAKPVLLYTNQNYDSGF